MANETIAVKASRLRPVVKGEKTNIIWVNQNPKSHGMFHGKTLSEVAEEFNMWDSDVKFGFSTNPKTGTEIKNLTLLINGVKYVVPFSIGANADDLDNLDECNNWVFRSVHRRKKGPDGKPLGKDENGNLILDETDHYLSFGRPGIFTLDREEDAFTPVD
jgi:hypothetical protein